MNLNNKPKQLQMLTNSSYNLFGLRILFQIMLVFIVLWSVLNRNILVFVLPVASFLLKFR